ncbi:MAG: ABC transporter permease subunit, partial [Gemmobacter sp.]
PDMRAAVWNTVLYTVGLLPLSVALPLAPALMTQGIRGPLRNLYRTLIFVPMIVPPIVAAILWRWLLNADHGLVNAGLDGVGLGRVAFLGDPAVALWALVWITGWKLIGFSTLLFSAANSAINPAYIEAARMDGAGSLRILAQVVVPNLSAPRAALGILAFISAWNDYFWPLLLIRRMENSVVQIGLQFFLTEEGNRWGPLMAAATLASLPILAVYLILHRQVIDSFMRAGIR